ncbi:MAG: YggS family pyridoxal phosphate-dependent enzyme [Pyrinomonadaceae bacterium]|nr:YggS family pyridoxal phosphate-dependent enzyme [Pyrinomonadaceae bacterium]
MQHAAAESDVVLRARLDVVRGRIAQCARRCNRAPEEITLVAVSKTHAAEAVREAWAAGARDFGENRVQETEEKLAPLRDLDLRWHLIGRLQANKARRAVKIFDLIHSIDSAALVERLERLCAEEGRESLPILVQVDLAGEATKAGAGEAELPGILATLKSCQQVRCVGLMTLPPFFDEAEQVRPYFHRLRELRDELREHGAFAAGGGTGELSMGMSHDFEVAIEEGATMVRVGTSIFGARGKA